MRNTLTGSLLPAPTPTSNPIPDPPPDTPPDQSSGRSRDNESQESPRISSRNTIKIITQPDGRRFRNGVELFMESESTSDTDEEDACTEPSLPAMTEPSDEPQIVSRTTQDSKLLSSDSIDNGARYPDTEPGRDSLESAIHAGDTETVRMILAKHQHLFAEPECSGDFLLFEAVSQGHAAIAEMLINVGAPVNYQDPSGRNTLMLCIEKNHLSVAQLLIQKGANVNQADKDQYTSLMLAVQQDYAELVTLLIRSGANANAQDKDGYSALMRAANQGNIPMAAALIEGGAQIDLGNKRNTTPLMFAIQNGRTELAAMLIDKGAHIEHKDIYDWTPLMFAAYGGQTECAALLISKRAIVDRVDSNGWTALMWAANYGHTETAALLIEKGAQIDMKTNTDRTALMLAAWNGHTTIAKQLIARGASLDLIDANKEWTPLMFAVDKGRTDIVELIVDKLIDQTRIPFASSAFLLRFFAPTVYATLQSALMLAISGGQTDTATLLVRKGVMLGRVDDTDESPLTLAIREKQPQVLHALLQCGLAPTKLNKNDSISIERLLALTSPEPDSLIVDILLDAEYKEDLRRGSARFILPFDKLVQKSSALLAAHQEGNADEKAWRAFMDSLCSELGLRHVVARALTQSLMNFSMAYSATRQDIETPTIRQLTMVFLQSVISSQTLHDLTRETDPDRYMIYASHTKAPEIAADLAHEAGRQAELLMICAQAEAEQQQKSFITLLGQLGPGTTAAHIQDLAQEAGWHPLLVNVLVESWKGLDNHKTRDQFLVAVKRRLEGQELVDRIEQIASDASRHMILTQLPLLSTLIRQ